jgi:hypothetical protein
MSKASKQSERKNEEILAEHRRGCAKMDKEAKKKTLLVQPDEYHKPKKLGKSSKKGRR